MPLYSKESLEILRQRIDLVEVVSSYVKMQRSGSSYKGLCPFHEEKTPSFMIHKGDTHYHCFGCGAHGDSIAFLMDHAKMNFVEALEFLSERFQVPLEKTEEEEKGPNKGRLRALLERASLWFRFFLLHSEEGHAALTYLYQRGFNLAFIRRFEIGYAPKDGEMLYKLLRQEGYQDEELLSAGIIRQTNRGRKKDFFSERVSFPIRDKMGNMIGFSCRKFKEETFGGKYINSPETLLFKKSHILFGLCHSRQRIAKERKALIVEGQIDALRLIDAGFDFTVAGQGTAFGEGHVKELMQLGVSHVYLALDADRAGQEAAAKIGDLFQAKGVEVTVVVLPQDSDPDAFLREHGKEAFNELLSQGMSYLSFYYELLSKGQDLTSPSKKNEIVGQIADRIRLWEQPVMVHESLKKLAALVDIPEETLGIEAMPIHRMKKEPLIRSLVNPDRVLEVDLLRFMLLSEEKSSWVLEVIKKNSSKEDFKVPACAKLFEIFLSLTQEQQKDWIYLASQLDKEEEQDLLNEIGKRSINPLKIEEGTVETLKQILLRSWMDRREQLNQQILKGVSEEEELALVKKYDELSRSAPEVVLA